MNILGIETSCDETAAAVYDGSQMRSNVINSQLIHKTYGGVVPELASREHLNCIVSVVDDAMREADIKWKDVDGLAVTRGPGLAGSLLVGVTYAKAVAFARGLPIVGVNHIEAHLWAPVIGNPALAAPFLGLIVSGGHTQLWMVEAFGKYSLLGQTYDDAVGEAFDKTAKMLGLDYPGGPVIDSLSREGNPDFHEFPRPALRDNNFNFSYSGLKTAVLYYLKSISETDKILHKADIAASFQKAAVETLIEKTIRAAREFRVRRIVMGGGVAANSALQSGMKYRAEKAGLSVYIPSAQYCTDNAAMIAYVGFRRLMCSESDGYSFSADPSLKIAPSDPRRTFPVE